MLRVVTTERTGKTWKLLRVFCLFPVAVGLLLTTLGALIGQDAIILILVGASVLGLGVLGRLVTRLGVWWCHE